MAITNEFPELPFGEQFLLWAFRSWVKTFTNQGDLSGTLRKGFCLAGLEDGYSSIDELLTIIAASATTSIDVRCPHCSEISNDEQLFAGIIAALQRNDESLATGLLGYWLPPATVRLALDPATQIADQMARRGMLCRSRMIYRTKHSPVMNRMTDTNDLPTTVTLH